MRNLALVVEYDGSDFAGWQIQPDRRTVQGELQQAARMVLREPVTLVGAGRTDAGVHARGQVASCYVERAFDAGRLLRALNGTTPSDLAVRAVREVDWDFHARRSALGKRYSYTLAYGAGRVALDRHRVAFVPGELDTAAMRAAAQQLVGRHDFAAFQSADSPRRSTVRTLRRLELDLEMGGLLRWQLEADGFLYKMCRALVGTLIAVGRGKRTPEDVARVLAARDRTAAGATAPGHGLVLEEVFYP